MGQDIIARGLAARSLDRQVPALEDYGIAEDGNRNVNTAAFENAFADGKTVVRLAHGYYPLERISATAPVRSHTVSQQPAVIVPEGMRLLDGNGSTLEFRYSRGVQASGWTTWAYPTVMSELGAPVAAGDTQITLQSGEGAQWSAGETCLWRFGSFPFDKPEAPNWGFAKVLDVTGDTVTIDRPLPEAFDPASVDGDSYTSNFGTTWYNRTLHKWPLFDGLEIRDLIGKAQDGTTTEECFTVRGARNIRLTRCGAQETGIGFALQYVENAVIEDCWAEDSSFTQASHGKGISLAETRNVLIRNFRGKGLRTAVALEAAASAQVQGGIFENTGDPQTGQSLAGDCHVFTALGNSNLVVEDFTVTGHGGYALAITKNGASEYDGTIEFRGRTTLIHPAEPGYFDCRSMRGTLDLQIAGNRELFDFARLRTWRRRIWLRNGLSQNIYAPEGVLVSARVYASAGLTFGTGAALQALWIGRLGHNGANHAGELAAGRETIIDFVGGTGGGAPWERRAEPIKLIVVTETGTTLNAADEYLDIELMIAPDLLRDGTIWSNETDQRMSGPGGALREAYFASQAIPTVPAGGTINLDLPIPDMINDDMILSFEYAGNLGSITVRHKESLWGAVRIVLENLTGSAITLAPSNLRILWQKGLTKT